MFYLFQEIVLNLDLAPTFIDIGSGKVPVDIDGRSLLEVLKLNQTQTPKDWRTDFLVEHTGEYSEKIKGCPQYDNMDMFVSAYRKMSVFKSGFITAESAYFVEHILSTFL